MLRCHCQDNLESATYEVFEKDTTKYVQYEEAVFRALCDRKASQGGKVGGWQPSCECSLQHDGRAGGKARGDRLFSA